jgi:hypothetical protein
MINVPLLERNNSFAVWNAADSFARVLAFSAVDVLKENTTQLKEREGRRAYWWVVTTGLWTSLHLFYLRIHRGAILPATSVLANPKDPSVKQQRGNASPYFFDKRILNTKKNQKPEEEKFYLIQLRQYILI